MHFIFQVPCKAFIYSTSFWFFPISRSSGLLFLFSDGEWRQRCVNFLFQSPLAVKTRVERIQALSGCFSWHSFQLMPSFDGNVSHHFLLFLMVFHHFGLTTNFIWTFKTAQVTPWHLPHLIIGTLLGLSWVEYIRLVYSGA